MTHTPRIAFFGGEPLGLPALEALVRAELTPELVVCNPDRPSGRGQQLQAPPIKLWAQTQGLEVFQPASYKDKEALSILTSSDWDLFVVVAYNFILPKWFLELPKHGVVNVHPSLLPKLRGASPIRTAILENRRDEVGVSILLMDEQMDHGPLLAQAPMTLNEWPLTGPVLDDMLALAGGEMLATTIKKLLSGTATPSEQDHTMATYTKKFEKADAELTIDPHNLPTADEALTTLCKIYAFAGMSDCFFLDNGTRIKIKAATLEGDRLIILRVIPEGKKEMDFTAYLASR
jgi:methionyl-tRNA formyltransferase